MTFPKQSHTFRSRTLSWFCLAFALLVVQASVAAPPTVEVDPALRTHIPGPLSIFLQQVYPGGPDTVGYEFDTSMEGWDFIIPPDSIYVMDICGGVDSCLPCWTLQETPRPHYFIYPWMEEPGTLRWVPAFKGFYNQDCDQEWQVKGIRAPVDESWSCMKRFETRLVNRIAKPVYARLGYRLEGEDFFHWPGRQNDWVLLTTDEWTTLGLDEPNSGEFENVAEVAVMLGSWYAVGDVFIDYVHAVSFRQSQVSLQPVYAAPATVGKLLKVTARADTEPGETPTYATGPLPENATFKTVWNYYHTQYIGELSFQPTEDQIGDHEVTFYASVCKSVDSQTVVISVFDSLASPVLDSIGPKSVDEMQRLDFTIKATDPNGDQLTLTTSALPANAHFYDQRGGNGRFIFDPTSEQIGEYLVTFYASDGKSSDSEAVVITVNDVNLPPFVYEDGHRTIYEGDTLIYTVTSYDLDGTTPFLFAFLSGQDTLATHMTFVDNRDGTGTLTFMPDSTQGGPYNGPKNYYVYFRAVDEKDPSLFQNSATVTLAVLDPNLPPEFVEVEPHLVSEGDTLYTHVVTEDPNGDQVFLSVVDMPSFGKFIDSGNGNALIIFTPGFDDAGSHWCHLKATDGLAPITKSFTVFVYNTNRAPLFGTTFQDVTLLELDDYSVDLAASDPDGDPVSFTGIDLPDGASVVDNGDGTGSFSFSSGYENVGHQYPIMLEVSDVNDSSLADTVEFTITVDNLPLTIGQTGGDADVLIDSSIVIPFNELIDEATITGNVAVTSRKVGDLKVTPEIAGDASRLIIQSPYGLLAQADTISITISTGVLDRAGFPLSSPYSATFTTGAGVYPGDTDNNGVVDERDILPVGRFFSQTGPARADPGTEFKLTPVHLNDGVSAWAPMAAVYADADGSGEVNADDICAITDNWLQLAGPVATMTPATQEQLNTVMASFKGEVITEMMESLVDCPDSPGRSALIEALGGTGSGEDIAALPTRYELGQNYPNPFNPTTTIEYALPKAGRVRLTIYNTMGQTVRVLVDRNMPAGYQQTVWDGSDASGNRAASGVYLYRLETERTVLSKRMLLLK